MKKILKYFQSVVLLSILGSPLFAQEEFREGYIIKHNNDTVHGLIKYMNSQNSSKKCVFLKNSSSRAQKFSPNEILGYRYENNKYYVSKTLNLDDKPEQLFLEYLINGIVDIYYYRHEMEDHYLIEKEDGKLIELSNKKITIHRNNETFQKESKEYIGILRYIFQDHPSIQNKVDQTILNHKSLINIAKDYHTQACSDQECIIYAKKTQIKTHKIGLVFNMGANTISNTKKNTMVYYLDNIESQINYSPSFGLFYMQNLTYINEKFFFLYELTYNPILINFSNSFSDKINYLTYLNDVDLTMHTLNNTASIRFLRFNSKLKPYLELGGFCYYSLASEFSRNLKVIYLWGDTHHEDVYKNNPLNKYDCGALIGIGVSTKAIKGKDLYLGLRYIRGIGLAQGIGSNTLCLNIGIQLFK